MFRRMLLAGMLGAWCGGAVRATDTPAPLVPSVLPAASAPVPETAQPVRPTGQSVPRAPIPALPTQAQTPNPTAGAVSCDPLSRVACASYGPDERGWLSADYLLWAVQSSGAPPLVVGDSPGTPRTAIGLPTTPGQRVLIGDSGLNGDLRSGFRISGGFWLGCDRRWGLGGEFLSLGPAYDGGTSASTGNPPLSRPFFNVSLGRPDAELVAFPGVLSGSVRVDARNTFLGAGAFLRTNLCALEPCEVCDPCGTGYRLDFLTGYRRYEMNDTLQVREDLLTLGQGGQIPPGTRIVVADQFRTENTFDGGLLALTGDVRRGRWSADFRGGVALGNMHRALTIGGSTAVAVPGQPVVTRVGGLLAQPSNIGRYTSDTFTAVPEVGLNFGYQLTPGLRVRVGYTFIYLPNTWRAGDQIDRAVDPNQLAGAASPFGRPAPRLASTGTAVQGLNVGLLLRY